MLDFRPLPLEIRHSHSTKQKTEFSTQFCPTDSRFLPPIPTGPVAFPPLPPLMSPCLQWLSPRSATSRTSRVLPTWKTSRMAARRAPSLSTQLWPALHPLTAFPVSRFSRPPPVALAPPPFTTAAPFRPFSQISALRRHSLRPPTAFPLTFRSSWPPAPTPPPQRPSLVRPTRTATLHPVPAASNPNTDARNLTARARSRSSENGAFLREAPKHIPSLVPPLFV